MRRWCFAILNIAALAISTGCNSDKQQDKAISNPAQQEAKIHAIVDATYAQLFGAVVNSSWLGAAQTSKLLRGGETYRLYTLTAHIGQRRGDLPNPPEEFCENNTISLNSPPDIKEDVIAVAADWDALPRKTTIQDISQPLYREILAQRLKARGISNPQVRIKQIRRVDLEGDGKDEVFINAYQRRGFGTSAKAGDYAFVLLRKLRGIFPSRSDPTHGCCAYN